MPEEVQPGVREVVGRSVLKPRFGTGGDPTYGNGHGFLHAMAQAIIPFWKDDNRHHLARAVAGLLKNEDIPEDIAVEILKKVVAQSGDPDEQDRLTEVIKTYRSSQTLEADETDALIHDTLGEKAGDFLKSYNSAIRSAPPPPSTRIVSPEFKLYDCVAPGTWFDWYVDYAHEKMDAPLQYHLGSAVTIVAAALGNDVCLPDFFGKKLFPNLYTLLAGPSTLFRKSQAIGFARKIAKDTNIHTYPTSATVEQTYCTMAPTPNDWVDKKTGEPCGSMDKMAKPISWHGRPAGIIYHSEFSNFLASTGKSYMQDFRNFIMDIYDGAVSGERRETKTAGKYEISDVSISMLCGVTISSIRNLVSNESVNNGFLPRFFIILPPGRHSHRYGFQNSMGGGIEKEKELTAFLQKMSDMKGDFTITDGAKKLFKDFDKEITERLYKYYESNEEALMAFLGRLVTMSVKIAMVYGAINNGRPAITEADMSYAIGFCRYSSKCLEFFSQETQSDEGNYELRNERKALKAIRNLWLRGERPVSRHSALKNSGLVTDQFRQAIESLTAKGAVSKDPSRPRGGWYILREVEVSGS